MRLRHPAVVGGLVGAAISAVFVLGETSVQTGYSNSLALFALSLPWSFLTTAVGAPLLGLFGFSERVAAHVLVYAMPVVSGLVWGGLYRVARNVVLSNRAYRNRCKSR